jgi:streptogramin lyase
MVTPRSGGCSARLVVAALVLGACGNGNEDGSGEGSTTSLSTLSVGGTTSSVDDTVGATGSGSVGQTGSTSATSTPTTVDDTATDTGSVSFDVGVIPDAGNTCGRGKGGDLDFSYIWVANSSQNAVSKINTQTMIEEGRYLVHPSNGNPSRTSVSLSGDVAVANRNGGITKVYANHADCPDTNGMPGLQTSSGGADLLAWGQDECVAWHTPMAYSTQRPVAWSSGTFNPGSCSWEGQMVWTASAQSGVSGSVVVTVLDGETGVVESEVPIPEVAIGYYGPYGAAFDTDGDFWFVDSGNDGSSQELVRVDGVTLDYDIWMTPSISPYGFTVDTLGRPWIAGYAGGIARFDPITETFDVNNSITGLGIQEDADGIMWMAHYPWDVERVIAIDRDSMAVVDEILLPGASLAKGVSIDFYGYVWVVDQGTSAFRIDPATQTFDTFTGLVGPYTYSDMTGWGLSSVSNPEG